MDPEEADDEFEGEDFDELDEGNELEDQPEENPEGESEEPPEEEPAARRPSRAQARIEALDREVREQRERVEAAERRANELLNGTSRAEAERRSQERQRQLEAMDPWDREQALRSDSEARIQNEINALRRESADSNDRAEFSAACLTNPMLAKVKDEVEARLKEARSRGVDIPRETLAAYILGEQQLKKGPKARASAERKARANLDRERARPSTGGSSEAPTRGRERDDRAARDKRLDGYVF